MKRLLLVAACLLAGGCNSPLAPTVTVTVINPMQQWALAHTYDVCLADSVGNGHLVPLAQYGAFMQTGQFVVVPISYCNPAE